MNNPSTSTETIGQFVDRARQLYSLPAVAMEVLELTNHPQVDTRALKECIENDPALTTKILRVVNSSLFGLSREVTDLNQALALLGIKPLKLLVLGFSLPVDLFADVEAEVLARYWKHTLTKAVAARQICETIWKLPGDEAFIAGLLQDIGILVLIQDLGATYIKFLDSVYHQGGDVASLEMAALGFDHSVLSARLLDHWKLPESLVSAIGQPHHVKQLLALPSDQQTLPQILHLSELITVLLTQQHQEVLENLLNAGRQYHGMTLEQLQTLVTSLEEKVLQLADVLSLQLPGKLDYASVLIQAHGQLAQVAEDVATGIQRERCQTEALLQETQDLSAALAQFTGRGGPPAPVTANPIIQSPADSGRCDTTGYNNRATAAAKLAPLVADPGLLGRVSTAVSSCRQNRQALSLVLVEIDRYEDIVLSQTLEGAAQIVGLLEKTIASLSDPIDVRLQIDDFRFGLILQDCDRAQAVELGRNLMHHVQRWSLDEEDAAAQGVTVTVGLASVALPRKNFPPQDLIEAAERCLFGARSCGGGVLKSINIY